jgi:hypothetical protein
MILFFPGVRELIRHREAPPNDAVQTPAPAENASSATATSDGGSNSATGQTPAQSECSPMEVDQQAS